ncbi:DUF2752 domain-containing protein [Myroides pelagicus]|uniref:DUF2752 domain-containing protein n=1 Tax=Myroides pelagicus TaxID=270914 RepID=A0A7K1GMK6_9FLAO|nr:DUF2752 domain-containing protein [Myroides pelagicus]MEC4113182.1 DUF2752 domain-containing protein [Myroides pelagicus]MTH29769.1 DUF2752 domain-containing protein [Myroides pelagicus]
MEKEILLKMVKTLINYTKHNFIIALIGFYFIFSVIVRAMTGINICMPCLWKTLFRVECPGCGLTTAFEHLIQLELHKAISSNWLILIIVPFGLLYIIKDFIAFKKKNKALN